MTHQKQTLKNIKAILKSSLLAAVGVVLPVALVSLLFVKALKLFSAATSPLARVAFPYAYENHQYVSELFTLGLLVIASVLLGLFAQTTMGKRIGQWIERNTMMHFRFYRTMREFSERLIPSQSNKLFKPALLIRADEMNTLVFVVEECGDDRFVIFMPSVPTTFSGSLHVIPKTDVELLDVPVLKVAQAFSRWGVGTSEIVQSSRSLPRTTGLNVNDTFLGPSSDVESHLKSH